MAVSTHSHPKVAASVIDMAAVDFDSFNTQPPEGGCDFENIPKGLIKVSTHSHPKVAA